VTAPVDRPSTRTRPRRPAWLTDSVLRTTRWTLVAAWVCALISYLRVDGIPFDRESQLLWIATGVAAASVGKRALASVVLDFLPLALVLIVYDHLRGLSDTLGMPTWWTPQLDLDRVLGFGQVPTVWLQEHLKYRDVRWWDVAVCLCYISFFFLPYLTAGVLWLRDRADFHRWAGRFVALSFLGFAFFALIPAAPPWAAAACTGPEVAGHPADPSCLIRPAQLTSSGGLLGPTSGWHPGANPWIERLSFKGWSELHLQIAATLLRQGQAVVDQVAAVPSLHAGGTLLFVLFMWRRMRRRVRPLLVIYVAFMAFTLVYSGEHYVVDCVAGWLAAAAVHLTANRIERRRRSTRLDTLGQSPTSGVDQCPPTPSRPATTPSST
jgi:membrane-associated phospholipid phosphatase